MPCERLSSFWIFASKTWSTWVGTGSEVIFVWNNLKFFRNKGQKSKHLNEKFILLKNFWIFFLFFFSGDLNFEGIIQKFPFEISGLLNLNWQPMDSIRTPLAIHWGLEAQKQPLTIWWNIYAGYIAVPLPWSLCIWRQAND